MTLKVQLVLLEPRNIELLARSSTLQLASDVFLVVADNPRVRQRRVLKVMIAVHLLGNDACRAYTLRSLSDEEFTLLFDRRVDIVAFSRAVWFIIMGNVVDVVLIQELRCDNPRAIWNDLVDPFAVSDGFGALGTSEDGEAFPFMCFCIASNADDKENVRERGLGLFQLSHMSRCQRIRVTKNVSS